VADVVSVDQDIDDDCPVCLFIRARAHREDPRRPIGLSVDGVDEMQRLMRR
jgi:hypothetical protein